jgi:hypothetical protein
LGKHRDTPPRSAVYVSIRNKRPVMQLPRTQVTTCFTSASASSSKSVAANGDVK